MNFITPVAAHNHSDYCKVCEQHAAREAAMRHAAALCWFTNMAGDEHDLSGKGCTAAFTIAKMAWTALGKPNAATMDKLCAKVPGWDGCRNAGFDFVPSDD